MPMGASWLIRLVGCRRYLERPGNITIDGPQSAAAMDALKLLAEAAQVNDTQCWVQLGHAGRQSTAKVS